jgi:hypothetical protein
VIAPWLAVGCGLCAAAAGGSNAACRKRRAAGLQDQEETLLGSPHFQTILQQVEFRNYRESMEDWMIASADLSSLVSGSDEEQAVQYILMIDQEYKNLEKTQD